MGIFDSSSSGLSLFLPFEFELYLCSDEAYKLSIFGVVCTGFLPMGYLFLFVPNSLTDTGSEGNIVDTRGDTIFGAVSDGDPIADDSIDRPRHGGRRSVVAAN